MRSASATLHRSASTLDALAFVMFCFGIPAFQTHIADLVQLLGFGFGDLAQIGFNFVDALPFVMFCFDIPALQTYIADLM